MLEPCFQTELPARGRARCGILSGRDSHRDVRTSRSSIPSSSWHWLLKGDGSGSVVVRIAIVVIPVEQLVFTQHAPELVVAQGQQLGGFALIILGLLHRLLE